MATILENFVGKYLLNKLVNVVEEEVVKIMGVKDELKKLERKMRRIGAYLRDAERRRINDESVNSWLNELKDVMYDLDDMIDLCKYNNKLSPTETPSSSTNSPSCFPWISCFGTISIRREVAKQVKTLNNRLAEIFKDMTDLNLQNIQGEVRELTRVEARVTTPVIGVDIVGGEIEEDAKKLVELAITNNEQKINLVGITGMGGIGKTTLAQKIYNDRIIQNKFDIRMWLHVSQSYSPSQLIREAIRNAGGNPGQAERESELLPILAETITSKTFFLVLDDAWNPDLWINLLQDPLKANATQGFILVTTRDQTTAMQMGAEYIHHTKTLSTNSGWELLCKRAYLTDTTDVQNLEGVGVEIVKRCGNLPLAIKVVAGVLATRNKVKREWINVLKSNTWSINGLPEVIDRALYLSYEDLSPQLKQCFLYCSLYPPNNTMFHLDIVEDWIAEGFIEQKEDQVMEDIAEECYQELIRRHLLESVDDNHSWCRMHDLLRALGQNLSMEESFSTHEPSKNVVNISSLRRLLIRETIGPLTILGPTSESLKLRTIVICYCRSDIENSIFTRLKSLRILSINGQGLRHIPESIGDLIHLRELDLDRTSISSIPESIGKLTNLLFLKMSKCELLHTLPKGITRLCNLHHLKLHGTLLTSVPKGLGVLQKLSEIRNFQVGGSDNIRDQVQNGWDLQELEGLFQLRRIWMSKLERARNFSNVLANKTHLKELTIGFTIVEEGSDLEEESHDGKSKNILENLRPPPCLEHLTIYNYDGKVLPSWMSSSSRGDLFSDLQHLTLAGLPCCTELPPLGMLPNLKYLRVYGASSIVSIVWKFFGISVQNGPNSPIVFPKLEYLSFDDMPNLEEWVLSDFDKEKSSSWQRIRELNIIDCPKLRVLPNGLQQFSTINTIRIASTGIKSIQNFTFECEDLEIRTNRLEILSNLPGVKRLKFAGRTPNLVQVSKMNSLEYIHQNDYRMERIPEWLAKLIEERKNNLELKLHLQLYCKKSLLERCLKDGPDWHIIKCLTSVYIYDRWEGAYLDYTKEPESYFASS